MPEIGAGQRLQHLARGRALQRNQGVPRAGVDRDGIAGDAPRPAAIQAKSFSMFEALTTSRKWSAASR